MNTEVALGIVAILVVVGTAGFLLLRYARRKHVCPDCGRATVPGRRTCPFCGTVYASDVRLTRLDRAPSPLPGEAPVLLCVQGPYSGQVFPLYSSEFTIGREAHSALRLEGMLVSREHALVVLQDGQVVLYDRDSTNGTYANGRRIAQQPLHSGDHIQIGPYVFELRGAASTAPASQSAQLMGHMPAPQSVARHVVDWGDYRRIATLGDGGMSRVYKGVSHQDGSTVAIKVFHQTDPYLQDKFKQEIEIGISLGAHPHIARVYGWGRLNSAYFMVMEYVDSLSLRERLQPGEGFPLETIVDIIGQTCDGLSYAHGQGVIHRDIKPENIMFSSQEGVKLVDFGIAKWAAKPSETVAGMLLGTSLYMSYEQAKGIEVDPRSDLYSLGVVLYEMLTGQVPFEGEPLAVVQKHITEQPVRPRRVNPSIPAHAEEVAMRALAKNAARRFQSAEEMARALGYRAPFSAPAPQPSVGGVPSSVAPPVGPAPRLAPARLVVLHSGQIIPLANSVTTIRRRDANPGDMLISRQHARICRRGQQFWLEDMGSVNGTHLNERRIFARAFLTSGDMIRLGHTRLRFERGGR